MMIYLYDPLTLRYSGSTDSPVIPGNATTQAPPNIEGLTFYYVNGQWTIDGPDEPSEYPVFPITDITIDGSVQANGIWQLDTKVRSNLRAKVALPPNLLPAIVERIVNGKPAGDLRFKAYITENAQTPGLQDLTVPIYFEDSGNFLFSQERLNRGLEEVKARFRVEFPKVDIDVFVAIPE